MGKFFEHLIMSVISLAVICGGVYLLAVYALPAAWRSFQAGEAAKVTARAQAGALAADTSAANRAQASCTAEIARTQKADAAIAKASQPVTVQVGQAQPLITGDPLKAIIGVDQ